MMPEDLPTAGFYDERIDMSYWWPEVEAIDVPKPFTCPVKYEMDRENEQMLFDEEMVEAVLHQCGGEAFVRSGYASARIALSEGSIIRRGDDIEKRFEELVFQHLMMQMPTGNYMWFRELLDLNFCHHCIGNLNPECRAFIRDGDVVCHHPRLEEGEFDRAPDHHRERAIEDVENAWDQELETYAERVAEEFDGGWSVDFVMDVNGDWYCTDMALDALYNREESHGEAGWSSISEHPGDCEHDLEHKLDDEYLPPNQQT